MWTDVFFFFAFLDAKASSRGGSEWPFQCPLGRLGNRGTEFLIRHDSKERVACFRW